MLGATGFVGLRLVAELRRRGVRVRGLARTANTGGSEARTWVRADLLDGSGLAQALAGVDAVVHLVHSMEAAANGDGGFAQRDRRIAENVAAASREAGVRRLIYFGGLGAADSDSPHLRSRAEVARILARGAPEPVHARAAMLIGDGCAPWDMLVALCHRAPLLPMTRWLATETQPIAAPDAVRALADLLEHPDPGTEAQLGGADVLTHAETIERLCAVIGLPRPPRIPLGMSPRTAAHLAQLVLPIGDIDLLVPLAESIPHETVVTDPPAEGINEEPLGFEEAARLALREAGLAVPASGSGS